MVLKQEIVDAFAVLGLTPDVAQSVAKTAYKNLAFQHHPDRNFGDSSANARFQEVNLLSNTGFFMCHLCSA
jgi:curved DNA-binding protein CbpA